MTALARVDGESGAPLVMDGTQANNSTWQEDIYWTEDGQPVDLSASDWKITLRCNPESTTVDFEVVLSVETDDVSGIDRILRIDVPVASMTALNGDYAAQLLERDSNDKIILWAAGTVSFRPGPTF